jgi:hypothetical protein
MSAGKAVRFLLVSNAKGLACHGWLEWTRSQPAHLHS